MFRSYRALFAHEGVLAFVCAAMIARMPVSMIGIGVLTMLSELYDSYKLAGAVTATFALSTAFLAPQVSRIVDLYGQRRVLPYACGLCIAGLASLLLCVHFGLPKWTLFASALLAGCLPNMSAMSRARWTEIYRDRPELKAAFSLEAVLDEICFIVGPPVSVFLCVALFPEAGPLIAMILLATGVSLFVAQQRTEPPIHPRALNMAVSGIFSVSTLALIATLFGMGIIVGTIDVAVVAFARALEQPALAGLILSTSAVTSCLGGLYFGTLKLKAPLPNIFLFCAIATAATTIPLLLAGSALGLCLAVALSGLFFAPTMIVIMQLVERLVPPSKLTEGMTWMITGLVVGVAGGAAASGWIADEIGIKESFSVALAAGGLIFLSASFSLPLLRKDLVKADKRREQG